jgi:hypothetical protein
MIKYFCDVCGEETKRNYVATRLKPELVYDSGKVVCEVVVAINGTWNGGVICRECLRIALRQPEKKEEEVLDTDKWQEDKKW